MILLRLDRDGEHFTCKFPYPDSAPQRNALRPNFSRYHLVTPVKRLDSELRAEKQAPFSVQFVKRFLRRPVHGQVVQVVVGMGQFGGGEDARGHPAEGFAGCFEVDAHGADGVQHGGRVAHVVGDRQVPVEAVEGGFAKIILRQSVVGQPGEVRQVVEEQPAGREFAAFLRVG